MIKNKVCIHKRLPQYAKKRLQRRQKSRAAAEKGYLWKPGQTITIGFFGGTEAEQEQIIKVSSLWTKFANFHFVFTDVEEAIIRIAFDKNDGAWSYIGTVAEVIDREEPTMNFGFIDPETILHEFGHMLGLIHEHQNPLQGIKWNFPAILEELGGPPNFWTEEDVRHNITSQYDPNNIIGTEVDKKSIMIYAIPTTWTLDDFHTEWNKTLSEGDKGLIQFIYPKGAEPIPEEPNEPEIEIEPEVVEPTITKEQILLEQYRLMFPTWRHIRKMLEFSVVTMAWSLDIPAKIEDREIDTVRKIYRKLYPNDTIEIK